MDNGDMIMWCMRTNIKDFLLTKQHLRVKRTA